MKKHSFQVTERAADGYCAHGGKFAFRSRTAAKARAKRVGKQVGHKMYVYRCPHCGMFHMTSQPPDPNRAKKPKGG